MRGINKIAMALSLVVGFGALAACNTSGGDGSVYYLNFKPEADAQWQELAEVYTEETGIEVTVLTAASGQYETTLRSEMGKTEAPTLFQVNGPVGLESWKDYYYDLSDADIMSGLISDDYALMDGDDVAGIAYVIESYGLVYRKDLLEQAGYKADDIKGYDDLLAVAQDIDARSEELGFVAFTSPGMEASSNWRYHTHLANIPLYYEFLERDISTADSLDGLYLDEFRQIWDLYINYSTADPALLSSFTAEDSIAEFVSGDGIFYQNGTWAYGDVSSVGDENLGILPIYIGVDGEENQGVATGTENYWVVNKEASEEDIQATLDFINWTVTDEVAVQALAGTTGAMPSGEQGMGFVIPYDTNPDSTNPLVNLANEYGDGYYSVTWNFATMPSEEWKQDLGSALTVYAADQTDENWALVAEVITEGWAAEAAAAGQ